MITDDRGQYEDKWGWHLNHLWHVSTPFTGNEIKGLRDLTGWYQILFLAELPTVVMAGVKGPGEKLDFYIS